MFKLTKNINLIIFIILYFFSYSYSFDDMENLRHEYRKKVEMSIKKDLLYGDFAADYAVNDEDMMNFLSLVTRKNIPCNKIDEILNSNIEFLTKFKIEFGNFDDNFNFIKYERIKIHGKINWDELRDIVGLIIISGRLKEKDGDFIGAMKSWLGVINFINSGLTLKGVQGVNFKIVIIKKLFRLICDNLKKNDYTLKQLNKLEEYFRYFSKVSFNFKRMYECERLQILGRILPIYINDTEKNISFSQKLEDVLPGITVQKNYWKVKEVEGYLRQYYRMSNLELKKRIRQFKKIDRIKSKNKYVNIYLKYQTSFMYKVMEGETRLKIILQLLECQKFKKNEKKWPDNGEELIRKEYKVFRDPFGSNLIIIGRENLLIIYSIGKNMMDDIMQGDDIVVKVLSKK